MHIYVNIEKLNWKYMYLPIHTEIPYGLFEFSNLFLLSMYYYLVTVGGGGGKSHYKRFLRPGL